LGWGWVGLSSMMFLGHLAALGAIHIQSVYKPSFTVKGA